MKKVNDERYSLKVNTPRRVDMPLKLISVLTI